jgi:hypothetical protein
MQNPKNELCWAHPPQASVAYLPRRVMNGLGAFRLNKPITHPTTARRPGDTNRRAHYDASSLQNWKDERIRLKSLFFWDTSPTYRSTPKHNSASW